MQHELTKEELEAQIDYKERRLEEDFVTTTTEVRERVGRHLKVTLPVTLAALTGVGLLIRGLRVRRDRAANLEAKLAIEDAPRVAVVNLVRAIGQLLPRGSWATAALLFGAGALVGRRMRRSPY
jgi:hypothetical protein